MALIDGLILTARCNDSDSRLVKTMAMANTSSGKQYRYCWYSSRNYRFEILAHIIKNIRGRACPIYHGTLLCELEL